MEKEVIAIACDHAGFEKKQIIISYLKEKGIGCKDFGCDNAESCDYPDYAHPIAEAISNGEFKKGISICGTGQGISITANKHQQIRSAVCWDVEIAKLARQHNDANICAIPARFVSDKKALGIIEAFLSTGFEGGRHERRIKKIPIS